MRHYIHLVENMFESSQEPIRLDEHAIHLVDALEPYQNDPSIYITFSNVEKVGINPQSGYDTPLGIYCYPLDVLWYEVKYQNLPFAMERPYVHVLRSTGRMLDLTKYSEGDLEHDLELLHDVFTNGKFAARRDAAVKDKIANGWYSNTYVNTTDEHKAKIDRFISDQKDQLWKLTVQGGKDNALIRTPGGRIWNITRVIARFLFDHTVAPDAMFSSGVSKTPVIWNAIFRQLGYAGVVDRGGQGIIHSNEPTQAVFFSKAAVRHVATFANNYKRPIDDEKQIEFPSYSHLINMICLWIDGYASDDYNDASQLQIRPWVSLLQHQWSKLTQTGESRNFKFSVSPEKIDKQIVANFENFVDRLLCGGTDFVPIIIYEIMRHPEIQTRQIWTTFIAHFNSTRPRVLRVLLSPSVISLHAKIEGLSYQEAWETLSAKVLYHLLYIQKMVDLVMRNNEGANDPYALSIAKKMVKPLERYLEPSAYTDVALHKVLQEIEEANTSPF